MTKEANPVAEALLAFAGATLVAAVLYWTGRVSPFVYENLHGFIAVTFLYTPWLAGRLGGLGFDYQSAGGLAGGGVVRSGTTLGLALLTWPLFVVAFYVFYAVVCRAGQSGLTAWWAQAFAPICPRWLGWQGAYWSLPPGFFTLAASQLLVVALPEELFFRGYLMDRLERRWPSTKRFCGAPVGKALWISSALFALGHVLVDFDPRRFAVFFPGMAFGWMRARSGGIWAGAIFHALCNLLSETLHRVFFS